MRPLSRIAALLLAGTIGLTACSSATGDTPTPHPAASTVSGGSLGAGFYNTASPPPPEGTITPRAGSWADVHPPKGYRVVLLTAGDAAPTQVVAAAVRTWAGNEGVHLTSITVSSDDRIIASITAALQQHPDLVISAGNDLVDPLATVTASALGQQFLVVGAELAEPTGNVTAADWTGASFRGEGLGTPAGYDPASFSAARAGRALRAGVAAVVNHHTGIVVWVS